MFAEALAEVELGESLGFDSVWMEEHHGVRDHYWPSPLVVLAGFVLFLGDVRLESGVNILVEYTFSGAVQPGAPVRVSGVKVGRVDDIEFIGGNLSQRCHDALPDLYLSGRDLHLTRRREADPR